MSVFAWVDADLDGAGCSLVLSWLLKKTVPSNQTTPRKFRNDFSTWYERNRDNYSKIFICDIDTSSFIDIVDKDNIVIFDHHETHFLSKKKYQYAKNVIEPSGSTTKLISELYKKNLNLTKEQLLLINLIDDYDSGKESLPFTTDLNKLFWGIKGNRIEKFHAYFHRGFAGFDMQQKNIIDLHNRQFQKQIQDLDIHIGDIKIANKDNRVVSTIATFAINETAKTLLDKYNADIAIIVNPSSGSVSFRRSKRCQVSMCELAKKIANGGGHNEAAGGSITESFLAFTKSLYKV